jgi:uncharacterized protein (TIGR00375 family)
MLVNLDLHIHSRYSMAVSADMLLPEIARQAAHKGVKIMATGDCLHPQWLDAIKKLPQSDGLFLLGDTRYVLSVEVEDARRVHHLIFLPDTAMAEQLQEGFAAYSTNLSADGRPRLHMGGAEIADLALEAGGMVGPAHAFTPWTGIYAYYRTLADCYQEKTDRIRFIELGLSADTDYADRIADLSTRTFLSNSDAHSPRINKLAREFNQMQLQNLSYEDLCLAIRREGGRQTTLNVGFYPEEGKYNRTACTRCYRQYSAAGKDELMGRCPACGGRIKLGVADRVTLLADYEKPVHPDHRPPYLHIIPLAEIIAQALGHKSAMTGGVQRCWKALTEEWAEIEVLMQADPAQLPAEPRVIEAILAFRQGRVEVLPGGGGRYGEVRLAGPLRAAEQAGLCGAEPKGAGQSSLFDF